MKFSRWALPLALACVVGCGDKQPASKNPLTNPKQDAGADEARIVEALKKAGITNPPAAILDKGDQWEVIITPDGTGPNGEPPPGRPIPDRALVKKDNFAVTKLANPGAGRGGRGGGGAGAGAGNSEASGS